MRINFTDKFIIAVVLSIAALPTLVNAQAQSLSSVNNDKASSKSDLKDSIKDTKVGVAQLIDITLKNGADTEIPKNILPVLGLPKAMPVRFQEVTLSQHDRDAEKRICYVMYENVESSTADAPTKRAVCAYIVKYKRSSIGVQTRYFRIDLNGKLETAVLSEGKYDDAGKVVRGSGVKTDQDIESPEVKKTFEAELKFWLKDWLKKEQKNAAKKTAAAATPPAAAPL